MYYWGGRPQQVVCTNRLHSQTKEALLPVSFTRNELCYRWTRRKPETLCHCDGRQPLQPSLWGGSRFSRRGGFRRGHQPCILPKFRSDPVEVKNFWFVWWFAPEILPCRSAIQTFVRTGNYKGRIQHFPGKDANPHRWARKPIILAIFSRKLDKLWIKMDWGVCVPSTPLKSAKCLGFHARKVC